VNHRPDPRDGMVSLEVPRVVPHQGAHTIPRPEPPLDERVAELLGAVVMLDMGYCGVAATRNASHDKLIRLQAVSSIQ